MFYRVMAVIPFTNQDEANDFYHDCELALPKGSTINPDTPQEEKGTIILEKCYHDEQEPKPCEIIAQAETD